MMNIDIKNYIENRIPELAGRLFPVMTTDISKISITYTVTDISAGHLNQSQIEFKVIWNDYDECMKVHELLKEILAMESDEGFVNYGNIRFHSELSSGGGALFNDGPQMWEISKYYMIDWRNIYGRSE